MRRRISYMATALVCSLVMLSTGTTVYAANVEDTNISSDEFQDTSTKEDSCLVNVSVGSSYTITLPKKITLSGDDGTGSYNITVKGNIGARQRVSVVPDETFNLKSSGKEDVVTTVTQPKKVFKFDEVSVLDGESNLIGTTTNGTVNAGKLTKGRWSGTFTFNVDSYEYSQIGVEAEDGEGNDLNAEAFTIEGQEKEDLLDALVDSELVPDVTSADDIDALIEVNSDDFDDLADTTFDVSSIAGEGDKVVILHYNEETKEWEYIGTDTVEDGKVSADFESYSPVAFIVVQPDGSLHAHIDKDEDDICDICKVCMLQAGLYNIEGDMICDWEESGIDIEKDYTQSNYYTEVTSPYYVLENTYEDTTKVVLPTEITSIGNYSFYYATGLKNIIIPNGVNDIGNYAFYNCSGLLSIKIPDSVSTIGNYAFNTCKALKNVSIGKGVSDMGSNLFQTCTSLKYVEIAEGVTSIGDRAFSACTALNSISIPDSVTNIGKNAFQGCSRLENIKLSNNITSIKEYTFDDCSKLQSIVIPDNVTDIGFCAFSHCTNLTDINIPDNVTIIKGDAFSSCTSLTSIDLPNNITSIGDSAFASCTNLTDIIIPSNVTSIGKTTFLGCMSLDNITIPNNITSIGERAFENCTSLTSITIPSNVDTIGLRPFNGCTSLTYIIIDSGNTVYDSRNNCNAIIESASNTLVAGCKTTVIPNSVTSIGKYAFINCTSLTDINIPSSVTSIGSSAFSNTGLINVSIPDSVISIGSNAFSNSTKLEEIELSNSITTIEKELFYKCTSLKNVNIPNNVTDIGERAFSGCTNLTSITIPSSVETIGIASFGSCTGLTDVSLSYGIKNIGSSAFTGCTGLTDLIIPESVTRIDSNAFKNVPHITYNGTLSGSPWGAKSIN